MTPAEIIASAVCSGPRFGGGPAPCEVCRGRAVQDVAALTAQGYVIVRAEDIRGVLGPKRGVRAYIEAGRRLLDSAEHPAQPSGTLQEPQTSGDGMRGGSDDPKGAEGLSALRRAEEAEAAIGRVREQHDVHSCERDGHIHRSTPTPCVNDGVCSCGRRSPCPTLAALDSPKDATP